MADRIPLVINNGEAQQLQSADNLVINGIKLFSNGSMNIGGIAAPGGIGRLYITAAAGGAALIELHANGVDTVKTGFQVSQDESAGYLWEWNNLPIVFSTNNTERMRLFAGLNIGGTTDPGAGNLRVAGSLQVGAGATLLKFLAASKSIAFGTLASGDYDSNVITTTGAAVGDCVAIGLPSSAPLSSGLIYQAVVDAADSVRLYVYNPTAASVVIPTATYKITVFKF